MTSTASIDTWHGGKVVVVWLVIALGCFMATLLFGWIEDSLLSYRGSSFLVPLWLGILVAGFLLGVKVTWTWLGGREFGSAKNKA